MVSRNKLVSFRAYLGFICLVGVTGCASLDVSVDILDPTYTKLVQASIEDSAIVREADRGNTSLVDLALVEVCDKYTAARLNIYDSSIRYIKTQIPGLDRADIKGMTLAVNSSIRSRNEIARKLMRYRRGRGIVGCLTDLEFSPDYYQSLKHQFLEIACTNQNDCDSDLEKRLEHQNLNLRAFRNSISEIGAQAASFINDFAMRQVAQVEQTPLVIGRSVERSRVLSYISETAEDSNTELTSTLSISNGYLGETGGSLILTDIAYAAANANEKHWKKKYNWARGSAWGGSTDTVIKLNETADFTVKGLVFDARAGALVAGKITTATVQLLAAGAGLPIEAFGNSAEQRNDGSSPKVIDKNEQFASAKSLINAEKNETLNYVSALKRLALSTLGTAKRIEGLADKDAKIMKFRTQNAGILTINAPVEAKPTPAKGDNSDGKKDETEEADDDDKKGDDAADDQILMLDPVAEEPVTVEAASIVKEGEDPTAVDDDNDSN